MMRRYIKITVLLFAAVPFNPAAAEQPSQAEPDVQIKLDAESGLKIAPGWETVKANCTACHSAKFITGQRGDRNTWLEMIRWMQNTQGLWPLDHNTEETILSYLASQYPPSRLGRRANLPAAALPPNPWPR